MIAFSRRFWNLASVMSDLTAAPLGAATGAAVDGAGAVSLSGREPQRPANSRQRLTSNG
jgi:hypothetical protein